MPLNLCLCPAKLWSNADFAPQNYGAMQTLPRKIMEPSYFAPQNNGLFILCSAKLWSYADFAPQNQGDIVSGAKITTEIIQKLFFFSLIYFFCQLMLFQRSIQPLGPVFKIFFVTVLLKQ